MTITFIPDEHGITYFCSSMVADTGVSNKPCGGRAVVIIETPYKPIGANVEYFFQCAYCFNRSSQKVKGEGCK